MKAGWEVKALGELVNVIGGVTPAKDQPHYYGGEIPWATVRDMNVECLEYTDHTITPEGLAGSSSKLIPSGEIVIASRVGLGKVCILARDMAINQDLRGLIPKKENVDRRFLYHWLTSIREQIQAAGTGATVKGVKLPFIKGLQIPLPPLDEQKRIVALLDAAFEGLTRARAHAEANLQNARELFESSIEKAFLGSQCEHVPLSRLIAISHGFSFKSTDFQASADRSLPIVFNSRETTRKALHLMLAARKPSG